MSENAIDSENSSKPAPDTAKPKGARKAKKAKPAKKAGRAKKASVKPKPDRTNKKAEVIALMKRSKGATLPEIMKATGWHFGVAKTNRLRQNPLVTAARMPIIVGRNVPTALGQMATSWPRTRAQWRRRQPDGCVSPPLPNGAPSGRRSAFRSPATRRYVQSAIPFLATPMARSCGLGRVHMQTLALISVYAPVLIIILAVVAVLVFFLLGFPAATARDVERDDQAADSIRVGPVLSGT
jgi:hypothetical protein